MSAKRPTHAQLRALEAVEAGTVKWYPGWGGVSYYKSPDGVRQDTVARVIAARFASRPAKRIGDFGSVVVELTDSGRAALDAARGARA